MPRSHVSVRTLGALFATLALVACGGNDDDPLAAAAPAPVAGTPAPPPVAAPPAPAPSPAPSTTVAGAVVKGPVAGAQVCAFTVVANGRGNALGSCTTSDASGNYSFAVPAGTGPLWVEASGGTYTDEVTGATATLPAGSPLRSIVTANAGTVTTMLTPLTTLALNAAAAAVGTGGTLDAAAFSAAAAQLLSTFNLPSTLNIVGTVPAFGSGINAYGTALTTISQMVANGTTLAAILASADPLALAAAYATAATPAAPPPVAAGNPSASGTLAVGGVTAAGAATSLTPQDTGFEITVAGDATTYRFFRETASPLTKVEVKVVVPLFGATTVAYYDLANRSSLPFCNANCGVVVTTAGTATHPVTLSFTNTPLSGGLSLSGSLVGDVPGAAWSVADLAGTPSSSLTLNGSPVRVLTVGDSVVDAGTTLLRSFVLQLSDGSRLALNRSGADAITGARTVFPATASFCATGCNITVADGADVTRLSFSNTAFGAGRVLNGTVDYPRTTGSLTSSDAGSFTPTASSVESFNDKRILTFNVLGTAAQSGLSLMTVEVQGGRVVRAQTTVGIGQQLFSCFDNGAAIAVPACTGVTVAADGRRIRFDNAVLRGGAVGATARNVTFNGSVVAKGP